MSTPARRRLMRDFQSIQKQPPEGVTAAPMENDIMTWNAVIFGPEDTTWEGATLKLQMVFSEDYPTQPPKVTFISKVFHPNVYANGNICIDILQNQWTSIYDIGSILTSIQSLLTDPNPNSPANADASRLFMEDRTEYNRRVRKCVEASWEDFSDAEGEGDDDKE